MCNFIIEYCIGAFCSIIQGLLKWKTTEFFLLFNIQRSLIGNSIHWIRCVGNLPSHCVWSPESQWLETATGGCQLIFSNLTLMRAKRGLWNIHEREGQAGVQGTLSCHNRCKQSYGDCWGDFKVSRLPGLLHGSCDAAVWTWLLSHLHPGCVGNWWF